MPRTQRRPQRKQDAPEFDERTIFVHRVSKVVKGGRRFSLSVLVAIGDGKGNVGIGMGKSAEVPSAVAKASADARKNLFHIPVTESGSIPHQAIGHYGAGRVIIQPAIEGTGVIAGGPIRPLFELAGITNVMSKSLGTNNALNMVKAAVEGLKQLESPEETADRRNISVDKMFGRKKA